MIVREVRAGDAPRLSDLFDQLGHPIAESDIRANIARLDALQLLPLVADLDGDVIGLCALAVTQTIHRTYPVGRIATLVVDERHRGGGVGSRLVAEAERRLVDRGCLLVEVTSNLARPDAHRFYERLGYEATSKRFGKRFERADAR